MKTSRQKPEVKKFNLRIPVDLMEEAQQEAEAMGISLNAYCLLAIRNFTAYTRRGRSQQTQPSKVPIGTTSASLRRVGRNDPCPCGSGKKAKHCHPEST